MNIYGHKVIIQQDYISPRLKIKDSVTMTESCREQVNKWLLETFGKFNLMRDDDVIKGIHPVTGQPFLTMNPRTYEKLIKAIENQ